MENKVQFRIQSEVVFSRSVAGAVFIYCSATEHKNDKRPEFHDQREMKLEVLLVVECAENGLYSSMPSRLTSYSIASVTKR